MTSKLTIIIPCLNSAEKILPTLLPLVEATVSGFIAKVIFADGGSNDSTQQIADEVGADFIPCPKGRGLQCKVGVIYAKGDWLLFMHDDCVLDEGWEAEVKAFINDESNKNKCGYFRHRFDDKSLSARIVSFGAYLRCKLFALPYGDQGLLISRALYEKIGGYGGLSIMEDVEIIGRIKHHIGRKNLIMLESYLTTSSDKYKAGYLRRVLRNFGYLMSYKLGKNPKDIAATYYK